MEIIDKPNNLLTQAVNTAQVITNTVAKNKTTSGLLPKLIDGEKIANSAEFTNVSSTDITFVLPDHRGIPGKLSLTNFRLYFKSDVSSFFNYVFKFLIFRAGQNDH